MNLALDHLRKEELRAPCLLDSRELPQNSPTAGDSPAAIQELSRKDEQNQKLTYRNVANMQRIEVLKDPASVL